MELESQRHSIKSARLSSLSRDEKMAESIMSSLKSVNSSTVYTSDRQEHLFADSSILYIHMLTLCPSLNFLSSGNHPRFALEETHPGDTHVSKVACFVLEN